MAAKKNYWFKTKSHGWGWGLPLTWQGWASFGAFVAIWLWALVTFVLNGQEVTQSQDVTNFLLVMAVDVIALVFVSFKYGEPPTWGKPARVVAKKPKAKVARKATAKRKAKK